MFRIDNFLLFLDTIFDSPMSSSDHGRIIKWTHHIGFLTQAGMARVVEGNHGNDSKRRVTRILCLSSLAKFDYSLFL